ncbi:hypothetical protein GGX14DRAFT_394878 [Mycena pura]|uniref:Uncharacterized protein n=1 Tax=Mycena pura TaxID=153505 RepID=A0AAD6VEY6_9AGAR|nr:hypothetical protein GGX14DRAFT_394878 [Mycena pura]
MPVWSTSLLLALTISVFGALAVPASNVTRSLERRETVINSGTSEGSGTIDGLIWQATGLYRINCYSLFLSSDSTKQLDPGFPSSLGASFSYTWKQYLYASTGTGTSFFHLMQLFDDTAGEPVVTLDAVSGTVAIHDFVRGDGEASCGAKACPTTDITNYHGTTTTHTISTDKSRSDRGKTGSSGSVTYKVTRDDNGLEVISYSATGQMGTGVTYVKLGIYRAAFEGMTTANAVVGDWTG